MLNNPIINILSSYYYNFKSNKMKHLMDIKQIYFDNIIIITQLKDKRIISGANDGFISIYSIKP